MAKASDITEHVTLRYSAHEFDPVESLDFIQLDTFKRKWKKLGLDDRDMKTLRIAISAAPERAPIIPGTGGLRKIRFAPHKYGKGKRGGVRICYAYFSKHGIVLFLNIYPKKQQGDLSAAERTAAKQQLELFERSLEQHPLH